LYYFVISQVPVTFQQGQGEQSPRRWGFAGERDWTAEGCSCRLCILQQTWSAFICKLRVWRENCSTVLREIAVN